MTLKLTSVAVGLALIAGLAPAAAGDYVYDYGGSIKDFGAAGVPVPAPVPLPMYDAEWYVRMDAGYALSMSADVEVTGVPIPHSDLDDLSGTASFSFGFGRYLTPSLRADVTIDLRNGRTVASEEGIISLSTYHEGPDVDRTFFADVNGVPTQMTTSLHSVYERIYIGDYARRIRAESDTAFVNLYYDLDTGTRFKPYIGAGVGAAYHYIKSIASGTLQCDSVTQHELLDPGTGVGPFDTPGLACPDDAEDQNVSQTKSAYGFGFAANLQAGLSAEIYPGITLDTGYKMTWMSGTIALVSPTPAGDTFIDIGDRIDHEIRTGLRFDIN